METNIPQEWNKFYLKDVTFVNLMMRRVYNVLIVANPYDDRRGREGAADNKH